MSDSVYLSSWTFGLLPGDGTRGGSSLNFPIRKFVAHLSISSCCHPEGAGLFAILTFEILSILEDEGNRHPNIPPSNLATHKYEHVPKWWCQGCQVPQDAEAKEAPKPVSFLPYHLFRLQLLELLINSWAQDAAGWVLVPGTTSYACIWKTFRPSNHKDTKVCPRKYWSLEPTGWLEQSFVEPGQLYSSSPWHWTRHIHTYIH